MTSIATTIKNTAKVSVNIVTLGKDDFYLRPLREQRLALSDGSSTRLEAERDFVPVTIINWVQDRFTDDDIKKITADFTARDDVWTVEFLRGKANSIVLRNDEDKLNLHDMRSHYSPSASKIGY